MDDLPSLRREIDRLDAEILERINARISAATRIGEVKRARGEPVYVPAREEEVFLGLAEASKTAGGLLDAAAIRQIWREIMAVAKNHQRPIRVAYLGPEATYNHMAARKAFGATTTFVPAAGIPDVFTLVERGEADYGVLPVENSTEGAVHHAYDRLAESPLKIIAQVILPIRHCLLSKAASTEAVSVVRSHPQGLAQCRDWLRRELPQARLEETSSTSQAVREAAEDPSLGAVASALAGELYDVPVLAEGIQDIADNRTRFLVVGPSVGQALGGGRDKTSFLLTLHDESGALQTALEPFSKRGINLSKIESRPSRRKPWDYHFFIDIAGHIEDPTVQEAVAELKNRVAEVKWLGSYPAEIPAS